MFLFAMQGVYPQHRQFANWLRRCAAQLWHEYLAKYFILRVLNKSFRTIKNTKFTLVEFLLSNFKMYDYFSVLSL